MKFSAKTVEVLKNFSSINPGLYFKQGNVISTMSPQKNILCEAVVTDEFPQDFGVHDLNNFLSVLTLNKDPEIDFDGKNAVIKFLGGRSKIKYRFAEASMIISPPEKRITLPSVDVSFDFTEDDLAWIQKTAAILRSPNVAVEGDKENVSLECFDAADNSAPTNSLDIGLKTDKKFKLIFKTENLKMIPGAYSVEISSKGIAHFTNTKDNIQYWIATEAGSTFED
jgi:hypothetical protein